MSSPDPRAVGGWQPDYEPTPLRDVLTAAACDRAIRIATTVGFQPSLVYNEELARNPESWQSDTAQDAGLRRSETAWLQPDDAPDLYRAIERTIKQLNTELYRFAIYGMDPIQIIRYLPGSFFNEHSDIGNGPAAHRKISLIVQLSDPADYGGGDVVLGGRTAPRQRGSGCVFPSWVRHRVEAITTGTRYSLAAWGRGTWFN